MASTSGHPRGSTASQAAALASSQGSVHVATFNIWALAVGLGWLDDFTGEDRLPDSTIASVIASCLQAIKNDEADDVYIPIAPSASGRRPGLAFKLLEAPQHRLLFAEELAGLT